MLKLKFNQNHKSIQIILNRSLSIKIYKNYIEINKKDLEEISKILDQQYLRYKLI